jgi:hypothetical protein
LKVFHCDACGQLVFFENTRCVRCASKLAYVPALEHIVTIVPEGDQGEPPTGAGYRVCANYTVHDVCNWTRPDGDENPLCQSCRLTQVIPDLGRPGAKDAWYRLEVAKRRLVYSLLTLRLPLVDREADPSSGLSFRFLADPEASGPVVTGYANGVITINVAEADDAERERRRVQLHEPYRTLLGHFRHESGHHYWHRLIAKGDRLEAFRARFGDERQDYQQALGRYYEAGPTADWPQRFISAYACVHPWEDWAETLTYVINNLNRGLGLPDGYPFVICTAAIDKLHFVHDTVAAEGSPAGVD